MNKEGKFKKVAATEKNPKWSELIKREKGNYSNDGVRSEFARDYTRILYSLAYRRLKHKTQVFFNIDNDHICTRMEHVAHVESISNTIAGYLGLNCELTKAISIGHDIGHAPFGHHGEKVLSELSQQYLNTPFWHEKNSLRFVDDIELLENKTKKYKNLDLTYAVRDGIIAHCGELDQNEIFPRNDFFDLGNFDKAGKYEPVTWEGCVVKIADKIAYIGRDIEDALCLGFLGEEVKNKLEIMAIENDQNAINTTAIIDNFIVDICKNSSLENGIYLSDKYYNQMQEIMNFNYEFIYENRRLRAFKDYSKMIIKNIFNILLEAFDFNHTWDKLNELKNESYTLVLSFSKWLARYCDTNIVPNGELKKLSLQCENNKIYNKLENKEIYICAILDYISGMTDRFAIKIFNELLSY